MSSCNVFGIGNALMDIQSFVPEKFLKKLLIPKGIMHIVEENTSKKILNEIVSYKTISLPGGSCANTMSTLACLGGKPSYTGIVGDDFYGRLYESKLISRGVKSLICFKDIGLTGSSIILTTEDAERTMNTHLGVCRELSKDDIDFEALSNSKLLYTTGYQWDTRSQKETIEFVMKSAKDQGKIIGFDIADPFCIERNVKDFNRIISDYVGILFGNIEEAKILTGKSDPVEAGKQIRKMGVDIVIVKVGSKGSYVFYEDVVEKIDIYTPEKVLDSTGCGDVYSGGFLYGYCEKYPLEKCGKIASYVASEIISVPGVQLESLDFNKIKDFINNEIV